MPLNQLISDSFDFVLLPDIELELVHGLFTDAAYFDYVVWLNRTFSDKSEMILLESGENGGNDSVAPPSSLHPLAREFVDISGNKINESVQKKLSGLAQKLQDRIDTNNHIRLSLRWSHNPLKIPEGVKTNFGTAGGNKKNSGKEKLSRNGTVKDKGKGKTSKNNKIINDENKENEKGKEDNTEEEILRAQMQYFEDLRKRYYALLKESHML